MSDLTGSIFNNKPHKEIKTGHAKLSKNEKKVRDANPSSYDEVRIKPIPFMYKDATESFKDVIYGAKKRKQ